MSGGVDSTASALLLKEHYQVHGFLMNIGQPGFVEQAEQVRCIAERLDIDLTIIDLKVQFEDLVLRYFTTAYLSGKTPNPCMVCNREIKCGLFLEQILMTGVDLMATGHYVRWANLNGTMALLKGVDSSKDQSYFLARLSSDQLAKMRFPLGGMLKDDTYRFMESHGFMDFRGKESQDICFLKDTTVANFLSSRVSDRIPGGAIVTVDGRELGRHRGLHRYTVGQRRGLGLPDQSPWYVCRLDAVNNRVIIGKNEDLFVSQLRAHSPNWLVPSTPQPGERFEVKIRYTHQGARATIIAVDDDQICLEFNTPQRGVSPGQFVVLYEGERVIGCAEIEVEA